MGRWARSLSIVKASWQVLMAHKRLLVLPIISLICAILLLIPFAAEIFHLAMSSFPQQTAQVNQSMAPAIEMFLLFLIYYIFIYIMANFLNSALVYCASEALQQRPVRIIDGFKVAWSRIGLIIGWSLLAATVGVILHILSRSHSFFEDMIASFIGVAWSLMSFLALPILVLEDKGPFAAVRESAELLKQNWGERLIISGGIGLVFVLLNIPGIVVILIGVNYLGSSNFSGLLITLGTIYVLFISLFNVTLQRIFETALYHFTKDQSFQGPFQKEILQGSIQPRQNN